MARALAEILKEINTVYDPQRQAARSSYERDYSMTEQDLAAQNAGLEQARKDSFADIETRANRRGMFFSGIPLGEQARYLGSDFLPAQAALRSNFLAKKNSIYDTMTRTIQGLDAEARNRAMDIRQRELELDEQRRQFEADLAARREAAARAASGGGGGYNFGGGGGGNDSATANQATSLQQFLQQQYRLYPNANRATQDGWVRYWAQANKIDANAANDPYGIWGLYNSWYPWAQYNDSRFNRVPAGSNTAKAISTTNQVLQNPISNVSWGR